MGGGEAPLQSQGFDVTGATFALYSGPGEVQISGDSLSKLLAGSVQTLVDRDGYSSVVEFALSRSDGGAFALYDFDFVADNNGTTSVAGNLVGGGTVDLSTALGTGGWLNLESVYFNSIGSSWDYSYASGSLDNVVVSAVPVPAAAWLFMSALGLLGVRRRFSRT